MFITKSTSQHLARIGCSIFKGSKRSVSSIPFSDLPEHHSLVLEKYGEPKDSLVLKKRKPEEVLPRELGPTQILIEHQWASINPADLNIIQGTYGKRPKLPSIVGNEGIARVRQVGSQVEHLRPGDLTVGVSATDNWQSYSVQNGDTFFKLPSGLTLDQAAQLKVNPCTAYRMLKDFCQLKAGDTIIQNGANSAVGVYAIQLAKMWGLKSINVIRDRANKEQLVAELKAFGADHVLTEAEVANVELVSSLLKESGRPKLFLNCVGGKNAQNCQRLLQIGGFSVTYGAMSRQPFSVTASSLIFKRHNYVGFWVSNWFDERLASNRHHEIGEMLDEVARLFLEGKLQAKASKTLTFEQRDVAFEASGHNVKYMFRINENS